AGSEIFSASANGGRFLLTRNVGNIVMDTDDVEVLALNTFGGADTVTVNDLAATDVRNVNIDLGVNGAGDAAADAITVNGTNGADVYGLSGSAGSVSVASPQTTVALSHAEPTNDTLTLNTSAGNDAVNAASLDSTSF